MMLPELVYGVSDKKLGFAGYLVIDSMVGNKSCGGVRMSSTVTLKEVRSLARNMTLKYGFLGIPVGGAKAGIQINRTLSRNEKKLILAKFGKSLSRLIKAGYFIPGTDMGTSEEDIAWLLNAAKGRKNSYVNIYLSHIYAYTYTSWTMLHSAKQALNTLKENSAFTHQRVSLGLDNTSVAIEGFGKIGSAAARTFSENGAKIVAISTSNGAIYNPKGLDMDRLIAMKKIFGDDLVNKYDEAQRIAKDRLFQLPVDILLPCAGSWTINSTNAHKVRAKIICPGANIPLTDKAEQILFKRGIICVPDFVSNSGAVLGSYLSRFINSEKKKKEIINKEFGQRVYTLLRISRERNIYPKGVAVEMAFRRFYAIKKGEGKLPSLFLRTVGFLVPSAYLRIFGNFLAPYMYTRLTARAQNLW